MYFYVIDTIDNGFYYSSCVRSPLEFNKTEDNWEKVVERR